MPYFKLNTYDIDGVINMGEHFKGITPGKNDIIITGRSVDEADYTHKWLSELGITNYVIFNPIPFDKKTRESSGWHKANTINMLIRDGFEIGLHFEDDEIQAKIIEDHTPVIVVRINHNLVDKENVWHGNHDR